jgi:biopolymer transport protein TolR
MAFGRLERTPNSAPLSEINMTPLIDVMLVLLVIFIITAPLMVSGLKVDLPQAQSTAALDAPKFIAVVIDKTGKVHVNDVAMPLDAVATALEKAAAHNPLTEVQLRADTAVPYGRVLEVMGLAHQAGLKRVGFVADAQRLKSQ